MLKRLVDSQLQPLLGRIEICSTESSVELERADRSACSDVEPEALFGAARRACLRNRKVRLPTRAYLLRCSIFDFRRKEYYPHHYFLRPTRSRATNVKMSDATTICYSAETQVREVRD